MTFVILILDLPMTISSIKLENFRSWEEYHLDFNEVTILIGPNGVGKTNILESIWLLAAGKSFRSSHDAEMINWDKDYSRITAQIKNHKDTHIEVFLQNAQPKSTKALKINGAKHRILDILGQMPAVIFTPETINMISGAPGLRRRFLDIMLSQLDRKYALSLLEYNKVIKERNKLLESIKKHRSKEDELDFWDEKLAENGLYILKARKKAIAFFNQNLSKIYNEVSATDEEMKIKYIETALEENYLDHLVAMREREIFQETTLSGPHRDDINIFLNHRDLSTFGSRGEYRSAVLAIKVLELRYIEGEMARLPSLRSGVSGQGENGKPILLLDDIFSELDSERRKHLAKIVSGQQTIITTTDLDHIEKGLRDKAKIVEIK